MKLRGPAQCVPPIDRFQSDWSASDSAPMIELGEAPIDRSGLVLDLTQAMGRLMETFQSVEQGHIQC
jgi:hypothetical protein